MISGGDVKYLISRSLTGKEKNWQTESIWKSIENTANRGLSVVIKEGLKPIQKMTKRTFTQDNNKRWRKSPRVGNKFLEDRRSRTICRCVKLNSSSPIYTTSPHTPTMPRPQPRETLHPQSPDISVARRSTQIRHSSTIKDIRGKVVQWLERHNQSTVGVAFVVRNVLYLYS